MPSDPWPHPVPAPRGAEPWRPARPEERQLHQRILDRRGDRAGAPKGKEAGPQGRGPIEGVSSVCSAILRRRCLPLRKSAIEVRTGVELRMVRVAQGPAVAVPDLPDPARMPEGALQASGPALCISRCITGGPSVRQPAPSHEPQSGKTPSKPPDRGGCLTCITVSSVRQTRVGQMTRHA